MANGRISLVLLSSLLLSLAGCSTRARTAGSHVDDFGDTILASTAGKAPARIVSLNPTTTEIIFALGAGNRLVGRSQYDSWPDSATLVPSLGGGIRPNVEAILSAHPDLVLLYASQDNRAAASSLRRAGINTLSLKIDTIGDFRRGVTAIGSVLGDTTRAAIVRDSVMRSLTRVASATARLPHPSVFWDVWDAPIMTVGRGSFLSELIAIAGGKNAYADIPGPSIVVSLEDLSRRNPDFIFAGPDGAKRIRADSKWRVVRAVQADDLLVVDTNVVVRPSVRLGEAAASLAKLLHPGALR